MTTHSITLSWKIPWMEESCRLQSVGFYRIGHELMTKWKSSSGFPMYNLNTFIFESVLHFIVKDDLYEVRTFLKMGKRPITTMPSLT